MPSKTGFVTASVEDELEIIADDGFQRLANALYMKDVDRDGYLFCDVAKDVVVSYSDIYGLGIEKDRLEDVLAQTSNGQHVDIQTLLRMLNRKRN